MEKEDQKLFEKIKRATIFSGIGMGLLLGIIIGLSVSETVKLIMGTLTALLGAFLGFDKRSFSGVSQDEYRKENQNALFTALRAGWFGVAVIAGLFSGILIRTNQLFAPSLEKSVRNYTNAGYTKDYALKLVAFERLAIDPKTGEVGTLTETQHKMGSNLFSAEEIQSICASIDPDRFHNDWQAATDKISELNLPELNTLMAIAGENIPENQRFEFLAGLRVMVCTMKQEKTNLSAAGTDMVEWQKYEFTSQILAVVRSLQPENQVKVMNQLAKLVAKLEIN